MSKVSIEVVNNKSIINIEGNISEVLSLFLRLKDEVVKQVATALHLTEEQIEIILNAGGSGTEGMNPQELARYAFETALKMQGIKK